MTSYGPQGQAPKAPQSPEQRVALLHYVAGALGILAFVWGFLDWFGEGGQGVAGYSIAGAGASAVIGLALVAGGLAAVSAFEKKPASLTPAILAAAGLLIVFGILISKDSVGDNTSIDAEVGLILALITAILQTAVLIFAWLTATGRIAHSSPAPSQPGQWQQAPGPLGAPPAYPQGGEGFAQSGPGLYSPPTSAPQFGEQSQPHRDEPPSYGPPQGPPSEPSQGSPYGRPSEPEGSPFGAPQGRPSEPESSPFGAPPAPPQGSPFGPPQGQPAESPYGRPPEPQGSFGPPQGSPFGPPQGQQAPPQGSPFAPPPRHGHPFDQDEQDDRPDRTDQGPGRSGPGQDDPPSDESGSTMILPRYQGPGSEQYRRSEEDAPREPGTPPGQ